jgi:hypothetical protein
LAAAGRGQRKAGGDLGANEEEVESEMTAADGSLQQLVYASMEAKDTEELLAIWSANDRAEWSDEAFVAIQDILAKRLGSAPAREESPTVETKKSGEELLDLYCATCNNSRVLLFLLIFCSAVALIFGPLAVAAVLGNGNVTYGSILDILLPLVCALSVVPLLYFRKRSRQMALATRQEILAAMQHGQD